MRNIEDMTIEELLEYIEQLIKKVRRKLSGEG
jgi:hypothetical protein